MDFTNYAKIIEGYIELLRLFPYFNNLKIIKIDSQKNWLKLIISTTTEHLKLPDDPNEKYNYEKHETITTFTIVQNRNILKGDE